MLNLKNAFDFLLGLFRENFTEQDRAFRWIDMLASAHLKDGQSRFDHSCLLLIRAKEWKAIICKKKVGDTWGSSIDTEVQQLLEVHCNF